MPVIRCNGDYQCDSCSKDMPEGTEGWIEIGKKKVFCLDCRTRTGEVNYHPPTPPKPEAKPEPKTVVIRHESSIKEADLASLKAENKRLRETNDSLRGKARELITISTQLREHNTRLRIMLNI